MFEVFKHYIENKITISEQEMEQIKSVTVIRKLRKKQYLLQEGDVWHYNAFVTRGCLRTYTVDEKGNEHINYFAIENWWTGDRESLLSGTPAKFNIDAVEESEVALINKPNFEMLCRDIPAFNGMVNSVLEKSLAVMQGRIATSLSFSAEERYQQFLAKYPDFALRIPQHMIASYLGITAETLSRIRKSASKK